jgi:hypothetical protein
MTSDFRLTQRALAAYWRTGGFDAPGDVSVADHEGLKYVVLTNIRGVLAVYRVLNNGALKRLRRWPKALDDGKRYEQDHHDT